MSKIENIVFDLGGVLINLREEQDWLNNKIKPLIGERPFQRLQSMTIFEDYEVGAFSSTEFYNRMLTLSEKKFSEHVFKRAWNARLLDIPKHRIDLLVQLAEKYPLYLLSNTNDNHLKFILAYINETFGYPVFEKVFKTCFYSQRLKLAKPGTAIYNEVAQQAGFDVSKTVFIDDSSANVEGAKAAGWQAIHFENDAQFRSDLAALLSIQL